MHKCKFDYYESIRYCQADKNRNHHISPPNFLHNVYRTYVTGAYMSTCRYINTCKMNVDLYVLRYECIQMYNVWCASDGNLILFEESKKKTESIMPGKVSETVGLECGWLWRRPRSLHPHPFPPASWSRSARPRLTAETLNTNIFIQHQYSSGCASAGLMKLNSRLFKTNVRKENTIHQYVL